MSLWQVLAVAAVQGLTEFLPISSAAHLILLPRILGLPDQGLRVDVAAHLGTFAAVVLYFRRDLGGLASAALGRGTGTNARERRLVGLLALGSLPVLAAGWWFREEIGTVLRDARLIAATSILFGLVLWVADRIGRENRSMEDLSAGGALLVGLWQALALIPGTSRSGATISGARFLGLSRSEAARFSFLLAIPVSLAVGVDEAVGLLQSPVEAGELLQLALVVVVAGSCGLLCIHLFLGWLRRRDMTVFVVYRVALGLALLWLVT